jgi:hypothetical protein
MIGAVGAVVHRPEAVVDLLEALEEPRAEPVEC